MTTPPRSPSAMFRAVGGNALLLSTAHDRAKRKLLDEYEKRNSMYRWGLDPKHIDLLASIGAGVAREQIADVTFELRQQFVNATATADDYDAPTAKTIPALPVTPTKEFGKP